MNERLEEIIKQGKRAVTTTALAGAIALSTVGCGNDDTVKMSRSDYEALNARAGQVNFPLQDLHDVKIEDSAVMAVYVDGRQVNANGSNTAPKEKLGLTDRLYKTVMGVSAQDAINGGIRGRNNRSNANTANPNGAVIISNDGKPLVVNGNYSACEHDHKAEPTREMAPTRNGGNQRNARGGLNRRLVPTNAPHTHPNQSIPAHDHGRNVVPQHDHGQGSYVPMQRDRVPANQVRRGPGTTSATSFPATKLGVADTPAEVSLVRSATQNGLLANMYHSMAMEKKAEEMVQVRNAEAAGNAQNNARFNGLLGAARGLNYSIQAAGHGSEVHKNRRTFGRAAPSIGHDIERAVVGIVGGMEHYRIADQEGIAKDVSAKLAADANKDSKYLLAQSQTHRAGYAVDISTLSSIDDPLAHKTKGNIDALKTTYAPMSAVSTRRSGSSRGTVGRFHR